MDRVSWGAILVRTRLPHPMAMRRLPRSPSRRRAVALLPADPAVLRVRRAGGPVDEASYSCQCGCVFQAPVSTTVACPHCEAQQPW
ncbi:MAG: hypothetical protein E6F96_04965 [Actinobacteria bacterium]|nr:MAG: hypothetical protein E6F96_04965 [Actinomycetota bacterium]